MKSCDVAPFRTAARAALVGLTLTASVATAAPAPPTPPGHNVHLIKEVAGNRFWRGGGPTRATITNLSAQAKLRGVQLTLVDLRAPATTDDKSGKGGRLSPAQEEKLAKELGAEYVAISALKQPLTDVLDQALARGDVYMHCMYGVNRTGFATARWATLKKAAVSREGLGKRDWTQGEAFQKARAKAHK